MNLAFTKKFLQQVSKIDDKKLAQEMEIVIEAARKADSLSQIRNLKKL